MKSKFFFRKFFRYLILFSLPIIISGIILVSSCYKKIITNVSWQAEITALMGTELTNNIISKGSDIAVLFNNSTSVSLQMYKMLSHSSLDYKEYIAKDLLSSIINNYISNFDYVESMYLYFPNIKGNYFYSGKNVISFDDSYNTEWFRLFNEHSPLEQHWIERWEMKEYPFSSTREVVSIFHRIKSYNGVLVTNLDASALSQKLSSIGKYHNELLAVVSDKGELLFCNDTAKETGLQQILNYTDEFIVDNSIQYQTSKVRLNGTRYVANVVSSPYYNIHFISLVPEQELYGLLYSILMFVFLGEAVAILLCLFMCFAVTNQSYKRLVDVLRIFKKVEGGTFNPATDSLSSAKDDEYTIIQNRVIDTFIRNNLLNAKIQKAELNKTISELKALQLEINPHFFFNTLQLIDVEIIKKEGWGVPASQLIHQLSDILRYSLENSQETVPLKEEISITKTYAEIQCTQHPGQIAVLWEYNESITEIPVMRLLLQPLLENSIRYSILTPEDQVVIKIKILDKGDHLSFHILDTGPGMSPETLSNLRSTIDKESATSHHIGLKNTNKRLLLSSEKNTGLNIISTLGKGTLILFDYYKSD